MFNADIPDAVGLRFIDVLTNDPGTITVPGTPFSAENMNHIEQGIFDAHNAANAKQDKINAAGADNLLTAPAAAGGQPGTKRVADFIPASEKGAANGVAALGADGKVPPGQLNVTKAQVGLGNVDNEQQATKAEFAAHSGNKNNPHGVTKAQAGKSSYPFMDGDDWFGVRGIPPYVWESLPASAVLQSGYSGDLGAYEICWEKRGGGYVIIYFENGLSEWFEISLNAAINY
jgi:hypothetical protein